MRNRLAELGRKLRGTLSRDAVDAEMEEELRFHVDMSTQRNIARGMSPEEARRAALVQFGGVDRFREESRDVQRSRWLEDFWQDARHAVRLLRRTPAFTIAALLTLALGIGANTAIFSVLDAVLLRPLPYARPAELISINAGKYEHYRSWTEGARSLGASGAYSYSIANITGGTEPSRVWTLAVTSSLLPTLGVKPMLGRNFTAEDDVQNAPPRVLLRYGFWQSQFGGDVSLIGRTIDVNAYPHEVIGILPRELEFPPPARRDDGSMPMIPDVWTGVGWLPDLHERGGFHAIGRLAAGNSAESAGAEMETIANTNRPPAERIRVPVLRVDESVIAPLRPAILTFTAGVALVLLIACANLGSMLLARFNSRTREIAVRSALGAQRGRIVRQVLAEGAVLAAGGCVAALGVAWLLLRGLLRVAPAELVRAQQASLNTRVLLVMLALGAVTAVLIAVLPAWRVMRRDPRAELSSARGSINPRESSRPQAMLAGFEVAFAVVLLVGGGLLLRSFISLSQVSPGFDAHKLVTADVLVPSDRYQGLAGVLQFMDRVEQRIDAQPGVTAVSAIDRLPYGPSVSETGFRIVGRSHPTGSPSPRGLNTAARPGYFRTMGIPMIYGREFTSADTPESPFVVVIGKTLADRYWPGQDPVGQRIVVWGEEREIVGVAGDVRHYGPTTPVDPVLYLPQTQDVTTRRMMTIVVQTTTDPDALLATVRSEIRALDPQLPITNLRSFNALRSERTASQRFDAVLIASFGALALIIAAVGIYGVLSFVVTQRTREIGVRVALGASATTILTLFLRRALQIVTAGAIVGITIALPLTRYIGSMLFGVAATDAITYTATILLIGVIGVSAALIPAIRAARVQPITALAAE